LNRIQASILSLLLLPGLAACNGSDSAPDTSQNSGGTFAQKGDPGPKGEAGINGKDGEEGKDGLAGINGKDGEAGKNGTNGEPGKDGELGKDGLAGKDGDKGDTGEIPTAKLPKGVTLQTGGFDVQIEKDVLEVRVVEDNVLRVHFRPDGIATTDPTRSSIRSRKYGAAAARRRGVPRYKTDFIRILR